MASKNQGELKSYTPSWSDQLAYWLAENWYGDDREGVQKAKRAVDAARLSPLDLPLTANEIGRSLGEGDYANAGIMAALGLMPGKIPAIHISPYSFDRFDIRNIGRGEGTQNEGIGHYFMGKQGNLENPMVNSYTNAFTRYDFENIIDNTVLKEDEFKDMLKSLGKDSFPQPIKEHSSDYWKLSDWTNDIIHNMVLGGANDSPADIPESMIEYADMFKAKKTGPHRYDVELNVGTDKRLPRLGRDIWEQDVDDEVIDELSKLLPDLYNMDKISKTITDKSQWPARGPTEYITRLYWPHDTAPLVHGFGLTPEESVTKALDEAEHLNTIAENDPVKYINDFYRDKAPHKFQQAGIPAIKYEDPDLGSGFDNYVVFNEKLIDILKRTALAFPGIFGALGLADVMESKDDREQVR